jgi:hypothetical protein
MLQPALTRAVQRAHYGLDRGELDVAERARPCPGEAVVAQEREQRVRRAAGVADRGGLVRRLAGAATSKGCDGTGLGGAVVPSAAAAQLLHSGAAGILHMLSAFPSTCTDCTSQFWNASVMGTPP